MFSICQCDESEKAVLDGLIERLGYHKDPDYFARCLAEQAAGKRLVLLIRDAADDRPVGYGMLNWYPQYALYKRLEIPEIQDINVLPDDRRRGAATALIKHCEGVARGKGCAHIGISVGLYPDYGAAQRLYVRLGYLPDGHGVAYDRETVRPGEVRPVDDDLCLMMIKALTPASASRDLYHI